MFYKKKRIDPKDDSIIGYSSAKDFAEADGVTIRTIDYRIKKKQALVIFIPKKHKGNLTGYKKILVDRKMIEWRLKHRG